MFSRDGRVRGPHGHLYISGAGTPGQRGMDPLYKVHVPLLNGVRASSTRSTEPEYKKQGPLGQGGRVLSKRSTGWRIEHYLVERPLLIKVLNWDWLRQTTTRSYNKIWVHTMVLGEEEGLASDCVCISARVPEGSALPPPPTLGFHGFLTCMLFIRLYSGAYLWPCVQIM